LYVPNDAGGNVTVLSGTCHKVGTVLLPRGNGPGSAAFDPADDSMYVTDSVLNHVYVIHGLKLVKTISSPELKGPYFALWDPGDSLMLIDNDAFSTTGTVVGLYGYTVIGPVAVGSTPRGMCYDPYFATVLVMNFGSNNITILNALTPLSAPVATVVANETPSSCAFDPALSRDYVAMAGFTGAGNVTIMNGYGAVYAVLTVGFSPFRVAWDQADLRIFVADQAGNLSVLNGLSIAKTITLPYGEVGGLVYDDFTDQMYETSFANDAVYIVS
jgi:DNA-binding beta-propeller fold protein YncE